MSFKDFKFEDLPLEVQREVSMNYSMWKKLLTIYADGDLWCIVKMFKDSADEIWAKSPSISKGQEEKV